MIPCDRTGHFKAEILDYGLEKSERGAVGVALHVLLTEIWVEETQQWEPWRDYQMEAYGRVWLVKTDGKILDRNVQRLIAACGWDGTLSSIANNTWQASPCQVEIASEEYKGETQFRINWVNAIDTVPGQSSIGNVTPDGLRELETRFGPQLRALAGNAVRNKPPASGGPPAPPPPTRPPEPAAAGNSSGIPF